MQKPGELFYFKLYMYYCNFSNYYSGSKRLITEQKIYADLVKFRKIENLMSYEQVSVDQMTICLSANM